MPATTQGQTSSLIIPKRLAAQKLPIDTIKKHLTETVGPAAELLAPCEGERTEAGMRTNIRVALQYLEAWINGNGRCIIIATRSLNSLWRQKITSNLHPYSLRSFQAKSNRVVVMNIRRDNRRTSPKSLLCKKGDTADQQHRCQT
jgi:hypothetical protein